jgi:hypothetical protein
MRTYYARIRALKQNLGVHSSIPQHNQGTQKLEQPHLRPSSSNAQTDNRMDPSPVNNIATDRKKRRDAENLIEYLVVEPNDFKSDDLLDEDSHANGIGGGRRRELNAKKQKDVQTPTAPPSTIKIRKSSGSHKSSSVPGLSSMMDMTFNEVSPENQAIMVRSCVKKHVFRLFKFYDREYDSRYSTDESTLCGFIMKHTNHSRATSDWWVTMRRMVVKTLTDQRNNAIKNMQNRFKGMNPT